MGPIAQFLDQYPRLETQSGYRSHLLAFLDFQYGKVRAGRTVTPPELARYELLAAEFLAGPEVIPDLVRFVKALNEVPPNTATLRFSVVADWLGFHDREIPPRDRRALVTRLPRGGTQTIEADLDREVLAEILQQMDLRGRAIALILASSGMRIGELLQVTPKDLNLKTSPAEITLRGSYTKTGAPRVTFISSEAAGVLREWLKVRDQVRIRALGRGKGFADQGGDRVDRSDRLFPFSSRVIRDAWLLAVEKSGRLDVDPTTNRSTLHLHMLRKYFHSQLKLGVPSEVVEMLMGHAGYLSGAYRRYTKRELAEHYLKGEPYVTILVPPEILDLSGRVAEKLHAHSEILESVVAESVQAKNRLAQMEQQVSIMRELLSPERMRLAYESLERE